RLLDCLGAQAPHRDGKQPRSECADVLMLILYPILTVMVVLLAAAIIYRIIERIRQFLQSAGDWRPWGSGGRNDPQTAVAAMMYGVATEYAPITAEQERHIQSLLCARMGLDPAAARACLTGGRRIASRLRGDLNSRLHQLLGPVEHRCS